MASKKMENLETGTTTVGVKGKDYVVLAADKRATMGYMVASKTAEKIAILTDYLAMTIAGSVGDAQKLIRFMRDEIKEFELANEVRMPPKAAATLLANVLSAHKIFPFWVQLLLGGMGEEGKLYSIDMLGGVTEETYTATGSGSPYALGVLEAKYSENMPEKDAIKLVIEGVYVATQRDIASGNGIDVVVLNRKGARRLTSKEVDSILKKLGVESKPL